jgi:hypothetical protein
MMEQRSAAWHEMRKNELFNRTTINENGCWIWNGPIFHDGYGNCGGGYPDQRSHRASYILFKGVIPNKMWILHNCNMPLCINPEHLYLGDVKQNVKDCIEAGTFPRGPNPKKARNGTKNGRAIICSSIVNKIRKLYSNPYSYGQLSKLFNLSKRQTMRIVKGESWK